MPLGLGTHGRHGDPRNIVLNFGPDRPKNLGTCLRRCSDENDVVLNDGWAGDRAMTMYDDDGNPVYTVHYLVIFILYRGFFVDD